MFSEFEEMWHIWRWQSSGRRGEGGGSQAWFITKLVFLKGVRPLVMKPNKKLKHRKHLFIQLNIQIHDDDDEGEGDDEDGGDTYSNKYSIYVYIQQ